MRCQCDGRRQPLRRRPRAVQVSLLCRLPEFQSILFCSLCDRNSLISACGKWLVSIRMRFGSSMPIILVGTHSDQLIAATASSLKRSAASSSSISSLASVCSRAEIASACQQLSAVAYFETSARDMGGVQPLLTAAALAGLSGFSNQPSLPTAGNFARGRLDGGGNCRRRAWPSTSEDDSDGLCADARGMCSVM